MEAREERREPNDLGGDRGRQTMAARGDYGDASLPELFFYFGGNGGVGGGGCGFPCQPNESNDFRQINSVFVTSSSARHVPKNIPSLRGLDLTSVLANINEDKLKYCFVSIAH